VSRFLLACFITIGSILAATSTSAQETATGPGTVELTFIPGGVAFFTAKEPAKSFGSYALGGAIAVNVTATLGIEAEVGASLEMGIIETSPYMLSYTGNVIVHAAGHRLVPFATGGIGGLTVYDNPALNIQTSDTRLVGNLGGGVKWFAPNGRVGIRGDYRFLAVGSNDGASGFFGSNTRYAHRVYGGVIVNVIP
jgi:hypothetical protein